MTTIHSRKLFLMLAVSLGVTAAYALETEQFVYSVENGEARVTGLTVAGQAAEMLSILETVDGIPVTRIAYNALRGAECYGITIPNSVRYIADYAFYSCPNLIYLEIPSSVTNDIPNAIVYDCPKLGATGNWATIAAEKVQYTGGAESGYGAWAVSVGLAGKGTAAAMGGYGLDDKVANAFIYAFGDAATNAPLMTISFDMNNKPVITTPPLVRTEGVTLKVLSTTDLADWLHPEERMLTVGDNGTLIFNHESDPQRFYKLKAE